MESSPSGSIITGCPGLGVHPEGRDWAGGGLAGEGGRKGLGVIHPERRRVIIINLMLYISLSSNFINRSGSGFGRRGFGLGW